MDEKKIILEIQNLSVSFQQYDKGFGRTDLDVIRDLNVDILQKSHPASSLIPNHFSPCGSEVRFSSGGPEMPRSEAPEQSHFPDYNSVLGGTILYDGEELTQKRKEELRGNEIVLVPQLKRNGQVLYFQYYFFLIHPMTSRHSVPAVYTSLVLAPGRLPGSIWFPICFRSFWWD